MASSIFDKDPSKQPVPSAYARERIEKEIAHLQKARSTRHRTDERHTLGFIVVCVILLAIAGLYFMDPIIYSWDKGDAMQAYLYLHNCGSDQKARALVATGILTQAEVEILNRRHGSFQDYYASPQAAQKTADSIINFMNGLSTQRDGPYDSLDILGKIRFNLFCRWGLIPPTEWPSLNPVVKEE
ncbi:MAG: hypothetical protein LV481_14415 [Methylacidiphilales bacterium]|nr:hypothetical protein [Candidatus Methylacidiphilales bacterium]